MPPKYWVSKVVVYQKAKVRFILHATTWARGDVMSTAGCCEKPVREDSQHVSHVPDWVA